MAHQFRGHGVDDLFLERDFGEFTRHFACGPQEQPVGDPEHVGLVHRGHQFSSFSGKFEGTARDALAGMRGDLAQRHGNVGRGHELAAALVHVTVRIKALGALAHDDQIHRPRGAPDARARSRRTHVGVEVELDPECRRDVDPAFIPRRVVEVRDRAEEHAVDLARALEHAIRKRRAVLL
jgi:hypothetical protein